MDELDGEFTEEQLNELLGAVYDGEINPRNLPEELYIALVALFTAAVFSGLKGIGKSKKIKSVVIGVEYNIGRFSAAKLHQFIIELVRSLFDSDDKKLTFSSFKIQAGFVFNNFMATWLETELRTARNQAFGIKQWFSFEDNREGGEFLRYVTAGDERVRGEHVKLDGTIKHIDDAFWDENFPPNGWNCRCDVDQLDEEEANDVNNKLLIDKVVNVSVDEQFNFNPAKTGFIFDESKHPYFDVDPQFENFKNKNFGLPVPPKPK